MGHHNLLMRDNYKAQRVLVISPYVVEKLKPSELIVILDDGCRFEDIRMLQKLPKLKKTRLL